MCGLGSLGPEPVDPTLIGYLESVMIGAHPFVRQAGAHAIEVRVRDVPEDSVRTNYAWIVYDFSCRALDSSKFRRHARDSARDWTCDHQLSQAR